MPTTRLFEEFTKILSVPSSHRLQPCRHTVKILKHIESFCPFLWILRELLLILIVKAEHLNWGDQMSPRRRNSWNNLHLLHLILNYQGLWNLVSFLSIKLSSQEWISGANSRHLRDEIVAYEVNAYSKVEHATVGQFRWVRVMRESAVCRERHILTE